MSFDWSEYLQLARYLAAQDVSPSEEARQRSAISRAYYAAYHEVRLLARQQGFQDSHAENHRNLIEYCLAEPRREWRNLGENLRRLRDKRNSADYDRRFERVDYHATTCISLAASVLDQVKSLRSRSAPPQS